MEYFIIDPNSGVKYNLNSEEGFTILHNYLKHYEMDGGMNAFSRIPQGSKTMTLPHDSSIRRVPFFVFHGRSPTTHKSPTTHEWGPGKNIINTMIEFFLTLFYITFYIIISIINIR